MLHIGSCCYQEETNNKWTYNFTNYFILGFETIIVLALRHIIQTHELHPVDERKFQQLYQWMLGFCINIHMIEINCCSKYTVHTYVDEVLHMNIMFLHMHICHFYFDHWNCMCVWLNYTVIYLYTLGSFKESAASERTTAREEPAVSYRWTGWVWGITGWS